MVHCVDIETSVVLTYLVGSNMSWCDSRKTLRHTGILGIVKVHVLCALSDETNVRVENLSLQTPSVVECPVVVVNEVCRAAIPGNTGCRSWQNAYLETSVKVTDLVKDSVVW